MENSPQDIRRYTDIFTVYTDAEQTTYTWRLRRLFR